MDNTHLKEPTQESVHASGDRLVTPIPPPPVPTSSSKGIIVGVFVFLVVLGVGTGYLLSRSSGVASLTGQAGGVIETETVAGIADEKTFRDSAEGTLEAGGLDGEGTHKLLREGGESKTAYLVSSVVNLDDYVGKKVKVWGETMAAEKAAWFMDVGKIEILQ